jgi:hypothetical protein
LGRGHNKQSVDNNESQLPQVPKYDIKAPGADTEFAEEAAAQYDIEQKPGFPPTGVRRKQK